MHTDQDKTKTMTQKHGKDGNRKRTLASEEARGIELVGLAQYDDVPPIHIKMELPCQR